jgi:hypothetical protein
LLNSNFNPGNLAEFVFLEIAGIYDLTYRNIIQSIKRSQVNPLLADTMIEALDNLLLKQKKYLKADENQKRTVIDLVNFLNSGGKEVNSLQKQLLKKELLECISNQDSSEEFAKGLSKNGSRVLLELFHSKANELEQLIKLFTKSSGRDSSGGKPEHNKYVLLTVLFLNDNRNKNISKEELMLFLIYSKFFNDKEKTDLPTLKKYLQKQDNIDASKMLRLIDAEYDKNILKSIRSNYSKANKSEKKQDHYSSTKSVNNSYNLPAIKRKIVIYFFDKGYLPKEYVGVSQRDIQLIFNDLIAAKDDFLSQIIRQTIHGERLIQSVELFITEVSPNSLLDYLAYFFDKEYQFLNKVISKVNESFGELAFASFNSIFLEALIKSNGNKLHRVFYEVLYAKLKGELQKKSLSSEKFQQYFIAESKKFAKENGQPELDKQLVSSGLVGVHQQEFNKNAADSSDNLNSDSAFEEGVNYCILLLRFYTSNGFFPWWSKQHSFTAFIQFLKDLSGLNPSGFIKVFQEMGKEEQFVSGLVRWKSDDDINELRQLLANHQALINITSKLNDSNNFTEALVDKKKKRILSPKTNDLDNFFENAHTDSALLFRVIYQFDDKTILSKWVGGSQTFNHQLREYLSLSPYFYYRGLSPIQWRKLVYSFAVKYSKNTSEEKKEAFHYQFLAYLKNQMRHINWTNTFSQVYEAVEASTINNDVHIPKQLLQLLNINLTGNITKNKDLMNTTNIDSAEQEGMEIGVSNAGVVILWPFLTQLFERLSYLQNGLFKDFESKNRAVYVLQHLVYKSTEFPEYVLSLNKLLVGMQMEEHLEPFVTLTENELEMADSLLYGLINNWEKVKSSTPEGVQETFLQREGILSYGEDAVLLQVEKKGVDVLMESIPWNLSFVKLPWMAKPLNVNWI